MSDPNAEPNPDIEPDEDTQPTVPEWDDGYGDKDPDDAVDETDTHNR